MTHEQVMDGEIVEKYVLGELSEPGQEQKLEEFEAHMFACNECKADVELLFSIVELSQQGFTDWCARAQPSGNQEPDMPFPLKPLPFSPLQMFCAAIAALFFILLGLIWAKGGFHT